MLLFRSLLFDACMYLLMGIMGILCLPLTVRRDWTYAAMKLYLGITLWLLARICGLRVDVRGPVPRDEVLVAAKHQSFLDILILFHALPRPRFVMKKELKWAPFLGFYAMRIGSTPVARGKRGQAMKAMVAHSAAQRREPGQLVIYPQGTRTAPGRYLPYKIGAGVLYERMGVPCVPVATNAGMFWGRHDWRRRPGVAVVEFLEPLEPGLPIKTFMAEIEARIETASNALMVEAGMDPARLAPPVAAPGRLSPAADIRPEA